MEVSKILTTVFKYLVMAFSASMTVYSLYSAFDGGVIGWIFGLAGIAVFEAAALYWQSATKTGREGQINVAKLAQWATMSLSVLSTMVGISLLTEWGTAVRDALPLGVIMIVLISLGLAVNMFAFLAYEDEEPEAKRIHQQRMIQATKAAMVYDGDLRALASARIEMEKVIAEEAPQLGRIMADDGLVKVREHAGAPQLTSPGWRVSSPAQAFGGGEMRRPGGHATLDATQTFGKSDEPLPNYPTRQHPTPRGPQPPRFEAGPGARPDPVIRPFAPTWHDVPESVIKVEKYDESFDTPIRTDPEDSGPKVQARQMRR